MQRPSITLLRCDYLQTTFRSTECLEHVLNIGDYQFAGASNEAAILNLLDPRLRTNTSSVAWAYFVAGSLAGHRGDARPDFAPFQDKKTDLDYQNPILEVGTASKEDIAEIVSTIEEKCINEMGHKVVILAGDYQTFKNIICLKQQHRETTKWLCPVPGEWHWWVHALMAIHQTWFDVLFVHLIETDGFCSHTVINRWDSVEKFAHYRFFHETFTCAALEYLKQVVPEFALKTPTMLEKACAKNQGPCLLRIVIEMIYQQDV
jgi:hypothetical protein